MFGELNVQIITLLQILFDRAGWFGVAGLLAFENATGLSPSEIVLGLAGWLLLATYEIPPTFIFVAGVYTALGSLFGTSITYWLARLGGRPFVERIANRFHLDIRYIYFAETQFMKWGPRIVLFGRVIPGVRILVAVPAGLARMPFLKYLAYSFPGIYLWCTALLAVGYWIGREWAVVVNQFDQYIPFFFGFMLVLAVLGLVAHRLLLRRLLARQALLVSKE